MIMVVTSKVKLLKEIDGLKKQVAELEEEVSRLQNMEDALTESESNLKTLFNAMTDVIIEFDENGNYISIAPTSPELLLKPSFELLGKNLRDVLPEEHAERDILFFRKCLEENRTLTMEYSLEIEGKTICFEGRATPKSRDSVLFIARDVTNRKKTEEALLESEMHYRCLYENSPFGIIICKLKRNDEGRSIDAEFLQANAGSGRQSGINLENIVGKMGSEFCHPVELAEILKMFKPSWGLDEPISHSHYFASLNRTLNLTIFQLSKDIYIIDFVDITEQEKAEQELLRHRDNLEELVKERTLKLEEQKTDLERMNKLFVGREFRIKELRDEIIKLKNISEEG